MTRKTITISRSRMGREGDAYRNKFIGLRAIFTDYEGVEHEGVIERFGRSVLDHTNASGAGYPILRTPDGRQARLDFKVTVLV